MDTAEVIEIVRDCQFPGYEFRVGSLDGNVFITAKFYANDTVTGARERELTRSWWIQPHMGRNEIVATCFKCVLTSVEHETRESFTFRGHPIYQWR